MRLLEAEIRKLNRPLTWSLVVFAAGFCLLLASGAARNAALAMRDSPGGLVAAANVSRQLSPAAAGAEAAGLIASMPGALVIALLAGGHLGGEWSGRTLKNVLAQHGRRHEVLAAKAASLWLAAVGVTAVCWAVLAASGPVFVRINGLPASRQSVLDGFQASGSQIARALLVLAFFTLVGVLAAVTTRGTVGTITAAIGGTVGLLAIGTLPTVGEFTPASFVEGWMGFVGPGRSDSALPDNFWSRFTDASGAVPGQVFGLVGLSAVLAVGAWAAWWAFRRTDVA